MTENQRTCFVISTIGEEHSPERARADKVFKHIIAPAVQACGFSPLRADQVDDPGLITANIVGHLLNDPLAVADLTGANPNVFYELAIRHVLGKPTVQIISQGERIPFDVAQIRTIMYRLEDPDSVENARGKLSQYVTLATQSPQSVNSLIPFAADLESLRQTADPLASVVSDISTSLHTLQSRLQEVLRSEHDTEAENRRAYRVISYLRTFVQQRLTEQSDLAGIGVSRTSWELKSDDHAIYLHATATDGFSAVSGVAVKPDWPAKESWNYAVLLADQLTSRLAAILSDLRRGLPAPPQDGRVEPPS